MEFPRLVAIETTNRCNAKCPFCPNNALQRDRQTMSDELFEKIIDDCTAFPLRSIEPFLNGEPFVDKNIIPRMEYIRKKLPNTKLALYSNGYAMTPKKIDQMVGLGIDKITISVNTLNPEKYRDIMGFELDKTLQNLAYLTDPVRKDKVADKITFRITRTVDTTLAEQKEFAAYCKERGVKCFIVGLFNYKGNVYSSLPVPGYPCEHITRVDILSNGKVTLCCMDEEGDFSWGDVNEQSVLDVYHGKNATRYRDMHRTGKRKAIPPCGTCNVFWPSLEQMPLIPTSKFAIQAGAYFLKHRPSGIRKM